MTIENNNELLREQLGKGTVEVFTTTAQTGKDFYAVQFVLESVISSITVADCTGEGSLCLLYTSPSPRDRTRSRMPSSA